MSKLNRPICATETGATGVPDCYFDIKNIKGIILMKKTKYFTPADMADDDTFKGVLQTAMTATGDDRIYPIFEFEGITDNSDDVTLYKSGYGYEKVANYGAYNFVFDLMAGGICLQKQLMKLNFINRGWSVVLIDSENKMFGREDSEGNLYGTDISKFIAEPPKFPDGSNPAMYKLQIGIPDRKRFVDGMGIYAFADGYDVDDMLPGILKLECYEVSTTPGTPNSTVIGVKLNCGKTNVYSDFATELADTGVWVITNKSTGASVVVSSATTDATNQATTLEFTGAAGTYTVNLADAATLEAANIGGSGSYGYEGIGVDITITP